MYEDQCVINIVLKKLATLALLGLCISVFAMTDQQRAELEERIKPAGQVCMEGDSSCGSASAASSGGSGKPVEEIYNTYCMACHTTGAAGAPKIGDAAAWDERLGKGIEEVYANAISGINGMPPKGTCMSCSDEEIEATVDYIVENSK
jgi:cytochrome c5